MENTRSMTSKSTAYQSHCIPRKDSRLDSLSPSNNTLGSEQEIPKFDKEVSDALAKDEDSLAVNMKTKSPVFELKGHSVLPKSISKNISFQIKDGHDDNKSRGVPLFTKTEGDYSNTLRFPDPRVTFQSLELRPVSQQESYNLGRDSMQGRMEPRPKSQGSILRPTRDGVNQKALFRDQLRQNTEGSMSLQARPSPPRGRPMNLYARDTVNRRNVSRGLNRSADLGTPQQLRAASLNLINQILSHSKGNQ
mmetsp:Transcript_23835/g.32778  ORF Transcript_23835/g.32778 Transcript_23835/m.32778 type:complete len:250 (+) Transcript_23835:582-1331(+)